MGKIIFLLGRPGSGKSSAGRLIEDAALHKGFSVSRVNDYDILYKMYQADTDCQQFSSIERHPGFHVKDPIVLNIASQIIIKEIIETITSYDIIIVELAREDYSYTLQNLGPQLLPLAYFLYFETDIQKCYQRIHDRAKNPKYKDDHFVCSKTLKTYYRKQNFSAELAKKYGAKGVQIKMFVNNGSYKDFELNVRIFFKFFYRRETIFAAISEIKKYARQGSKKLRKLISASSVSHESAVTSGDIGIKEATNL